MKNSTTKTIRFIATFLFVAGSSCQNSSSTEEQKAQNRRQLDTLLANGKSVRYVDSRAKANRLTLDGDPIVSKSASVGGLETSEITYNTSLMTIVSKSDLEAYSMSFIDARKAELGIASKDLRQAENFITQAKKDLLTLRFSRIKNDKMVKNAHVTLIFQRMKGAESQYTLRELRNRSFGSILVKNLDSTLSEKKDLDLATGLDGYEIVTSQDVIYPKVNSDSVEFFLAREFFIDHKESDQHLTITLAAGTHEVLEAYSSKLHIKHEFATSTFNTNYLAPEKTEIPLAFVGLGSPTNTTDGDGIGDIPAGFNTNSVLLSGPRTKIIDASANVILGGPAMAVPGTTVGAKTMITADSQLQEQALVTWQAVQRMNRLVRRHLTPVQASLLDQAIPAYINAADSCNALYDGQESIMIFFREGTIEGGTTCAATALLTDVVAHEWCHALDDKTGQPGIFDSPFSEGIGDICGALLTGNPDTGAGLFLDSTTPVRSIENERVYPTDIVGQVHQDGQIIGGAFWHLREELIAEYGEEKGQFKAEELFFRHLVDSNAFLDSYATLLTLDDDDGNPATQSPNFCMINKAFSRHGLATLAANCQNIPVSPLGATANSDIFFGLESVAGNENFNWVVSGQEVAAVELCFGTPEECLLSERDNLKFTHNGLKNDRDFFSSKLIASPKGQTQITIIASHYYGTKSYRTFATSDK